MQKLLTHEMVKGRRLLLKTRLRGASWTLAICMGITAGIFALLMCFQAPKLGGVPHVMQRWEHVLATAAIVVLLCGVAWFVFRMSRPELRLRCPCCRAAIDDAMTLFKVTASCRCPHCEQVIFGGDGTQLVNHVYQKPPRSYERFESKTTLWLIAIWGAAGTFWCVVAKQMLDHWQLPWEAAVGEVAYPFVRVLVAAPGVVILPLGLIHAFRTWEFKSKKCPHCQESLDGELVALTGCCGRCGGVARPDRVIAPVEPSTEEMLGLAELRDHCTATAQRIESLSSRQLLTAFFSVIVLLVASRWIGATLTNCLLFVVLGVLFRGMWQLDQIGNQVQCPLCSYPWLRHRWWVIASRRCGGCGRRVLKG